MEKKNYGTIILIAILCLIIGCAGGYLINNHQNDKNIDEEITQNDENQQESEEKFILYKSVDNDGVYAVYIKQDGNLYIKYDDKELNDKYGEYKIAENVSDFEILSVGNGGANGLYFITKDNTVGYADIETSAYSESGISIKNDLGYKNIITIMPWLYGDDISGFWDAAFVDDTGKIHKQY